MSKEEVEELTPAQKFVLINNGNVFCWKTFLTGWAKKFTNFIFETILSPEFLVWVVFTIIFFSYYTEAKELMPLLIYAGISIVFIIARSIRHVLEHKTTLAIQMSASASATAALTGDIATMAKTAIEAAKGAAKGADKEKKS